ncbi:MAG: V-type ATP synthase subunit E [Thaumarchaeota archaeon]|nr:MAG: V-type ATP synthase subunit E [Nitrosopumilales archaeon]MCH6585474.1 V-type ATP synthase subunit E [Nitrososphaerota archaeon]
MTSEPKLEITINKILNQSEVEILASLKTSYDESLETLSKSQSSLEQDYDRILDEGRKESEKIEKQIVGSSDLESRNKQLLLVEASVVKVFDKAIEKIGATSRNENYSKLITTLLDESTEALGTTEVMVYTNSKDQDVVKPLLSKYSGSELSSETIDCLGGVEVKSKDGFMSFNNTIDSRLERMKPLIRKEIASKFGLGS